MLSQINIEKVRFQELQHKYNDVSNHFSEQNMRYEEEKCKYEVLLGSIYV